LVWYAPRRVATKVYSAELLPFSRRFPRWTKTIASLAVMSNLLRPLVSLTQPTRARLRSSQILTTLAQIISELVQNSLDAGAKHVDVGVDAEGWECWVRDDGCGMSREDLGKLDGRYSASPDGMHNVMLKRY
jgi:signal transduction histidine kinase